MNKPPVTGACFVCGLPSTKCPQPAGGGLWAFILYALQWALQLRQERKRRGGSSVEQLQTDTTHHSAIVHYHLAEGPECGCTGAGSPRKKG